MLMTMLRLWYWLWVVELSNVRSWETDKQNVSDQLCRSLYTVSLQLIDFGLFISFSSMFQYQAQPLTISIKYRVCIHIRELVDSLVGMAPTHPLSPNKYNSPELLNAVAFSDMQPALRVFLYTVRFSKEVKCSATRIHWKLLNRQFCHTCIFFFFFKRSIVNWQTWLPLFWHKMISFPPVHDPWLTEVY